MPSKRVSIVGGCAVTGTALALLVAGAASASAASTTRYVATSGQDTGTCSTQTSPCATINYAIGQAAGGDTISIAKGTYAQNVSVTKSVTLRGAGTGSTGTTITGSGTTEPGIDVDGSAAGSVSVTITQLAVSDNVGTKGSSSNPGIAVSAADADITHTVVSGNGSDGIVTSLAGASDNDPSEPYVTVSDSQLTDNANEGLDVGAGIATLTNSVASDNLDGGVVVAGGSATVSQSTLDGNTGAGLVVLGSHSTATLTRSTVSNSKPFKGFGSGDGYGVGVLVFPETSALIDTSTVYGNTHQGVLALGGTATVDNSTISATRAGAASGNGYDNGALVPAVVVAGTAPTSSSSPGSIIVTGSIDAANAVPDCAGTTKNIHDGGYNLADDSSCGLKAQGSRQKIAAKLGALRDNGGPTKTLLPASTSPAADAIPLGSAHCDRNTTDERGVARPQGPRCDIGAVEIAQKPLKITTGSLPKGRIGKSYRVRLNATGGLGKPYDFSRSGSLPAGLKLSSAGVISGKPTKAGTYRFTVTVDKQTSKKFDLTVAKAS